MQSNQSVEESLQHQTVKELFTEVESSIAAEASANNNSTLQNPPRMPYDLELRLGADVRMTGSNAAETNARLHTALVQADEENQEIVRKFEEEAKVCVSKYIKLIVMPQTAAELVNQMKEGVHVISHALGRGGDGVDSFKPGLGVHFMLSTACKSISVAVNACSC